MCFIFPGKTRESGKTQGFMRPRLAPMLGVRQCSRRVIGQSCGRCPVKYEMHRCMPGMSRTDPRHGAQQMDWLQASRNPRTGLPGCTQSTACGVMVLRKGQAGREVSDGPHIRDGSLAWRAHPSTAGQGRPSLFPHFPRQFRACALFMGKWKIPVCHRRVPPCSSLGRARQTQSDRCSASHETKG